MRQWEYGKLYKKFNIRVGEIWMVDNGAGIIKGHDIFNPLPEFMLDADLILCDPPWNLGNLNTFYTKAEKRHEHKKKFSLFYNQLFKQIDYINPSTLYIEIGLQYFDVFLNEVTKRYSFVQSWDTTYYKKNPNKYIRGSIQQLNNKLKAGEKP
jgi:hypothetical protein